MRGFSSIALALSFCASLAACFSDEDLGGPSQGAAGAGASSANEAGAAGEAPSDAPVLCRAYCGARSPECEERASCEAACSSVFLEHPSCASLSSQYFYCRALHDCNDAASCQREREQSEQCYSPMAAP